jgi:D-xylose transport system substrate-binding protein
MKRSKLVSLVAFTLISGFIIFLSGFKSQDKVKVGFLVHDLVDDRWKKDMDNFMVKIDELGGEPISFNALGNAQTQLKQGMKLIDEGVKVIAVVPEDGKILAELVEYADRAGAKIIAYDRMILNCNLHYYISFNSERVGEMMAEYALKQKPTGNYVIINGPSSDNNALLVRKGIENRLKKAVEQGDVKIIMEKSCDAWYALNAMIMMDEFISSNNQPIDAVIAGSDGLSTGVIDAFKSAQKSVPPVVTGQDASLEACKNIMAGTQSMTIFKSPNQIAQQAAILAMKIAKNEKVQVTKTINNGMKDVPSILFDPVMISKSNLKEVLVSGGIFKEKDLAQ